MAKQHTVPLILTGKPENLNTQLLEPVNFGLRTSQGEQKLYDEGWIQNLIHYNPSMLPVRELEPAFFPLYAVCRELKTPAGYLDNLFVSENGSLTLVECKLWRNPEARREVVGQALDYAKEFAGWQYEDLANAIQETTGISGNHLFDTVAKQVEDLDEANFVDAVSRNLSRGRFLILIVGDGIREGVENISNFLQKHAGLDFTFGLVELGVFKIPASEQYIIQPRILARTYTIERSVIRIEERPGRIDTIVEDTENKQVSYKSNGRRTNISEEQFYEDIAANSSKEVAEELKFFADRLSALDIVPGFGASSLNLRWSPDGNLKFNFGSIAKSMIVDTSIVNWVLNKLGKISIGHEYQQKISNIIPDSYVREHENPDCWEVHKHNQRITISDLLAQKDKWLDIIKEVQGKIFESLST